MKTKNTFGPVLRCQICKSTKLQNILDLGHQPVLQEYLTKKMLHEPETTYPLNVVLCNECSLIQLDYVIDPKVVFMRQYPYRTGLTNMLVRNFAELAATSLKTGYWKAGDLILDIGSNDGTLLQQFKDRGARVVGVEPTDVARIANRAGIPTLQQYFNAQSVAEIKKKFGMPSVITATNVFAHINDVQTLVKNIKSLMNKDSVFISESQYACDMVEKCAFDTIYNEHLRYYSLKPMMHMFKMNGMSVVDAERIEAAGGSIRVFAMRGTHALSARGKKLLAQERKLGLYSQKSLRAFADTVLKRKHTLLELLSGLKKQGARIVGITSAGRSNALLGFTKINQTILDYNVEKRGSPKIGMYTPGTHILVDDESRLIAEQPEYALMLSWHIGEELMKKLRALGYTGTFIVPLPHPRIIRK